MDIRSLKREVESLPEVSPALKMLEQQWLRKISREFLPVLGDEQQQVLRQVLDEAKKDLKAVERGQHLASRLRSQAHLLVELKLAQLTGDSSKAQMLIRRFLVDDIVHIRGTLQDIRAFRSALQALQQHAERMPRLLENLPLEYRVASWKLPFPLLQRWADQQQHLGVQLGKQFVLLARGVKR